MKKFAKLFVVALSVVLVASMFALNPAARADNTDPRTLEPASNNVIFIMDAPEGETLPGDGTGRDADNPYQPIDHELFDPTKTGTKYYQSSWYQATELLKDTGGTVVICGPVLMDASIGSNDHASTSDVHTATFGKNTIKFTSVYNGVDYRETNGAKITVQTPAEIGVHGQSIWENIDIETDGTNRVLHCDHYATRLGEGINCYPKEADYAGVASYYISVAGGGRYEGGYDLTPNVLIQSGTYNIVVPGVWGANNWRSTTTKNSYNNDGETNANLTLEGSTKVIGYIYGTTRWTAEFSGNTTITINGGTYECDIFGVGDTGLLTREGVAKLIINGGDFSKAWSIDSIVSGHKFNPPAASILDFTGWTGTEAGLAAAYNLAKNGTTPYSNIKLPEGVDENALANIAPETQAPATDAVETQPQGGAVIGGNNGAVIGGVIGGTEAPETDEQQAIGVGDTGSSNLGLIIGIAAGAVVVIGAIVAIIIVASKKKKKKAE